MSRHVPVAGGREVPYGVLPSSVVSTPPPPVAGAMRRDSCAVKTYLMPRVARQKGAFLAHHVVHRGINRQPIFCDDYDRLTFLRLLAESATHFGLRVWSYCLMTNHYHLFVEDPHAQLSEVLHRLNGMYTTKFNLRHRCEGALLRGRFFSKPVYTVDYKLTLFRYIHMNPVHAGLVEYPEAYRWSSYNDFLVPSAAGFVQTRALMQILAHLQVTSTNLRAWMLDAASPYLMHAIKLRVLRRYVLATKEGQETDEAPASRSAEPVVAGAVFDPSTCTKHSASHTRSALAAVARRHALRVEEILTTSRSTKGAAILARAEAILACRHDVGLRREELGALFGMASPSVGPALARAKAYVRAARDGTPTDSLGNSSTRASRGVD